MRFPKNAILSFARKRIAELDQSFEDEAVRCRENTADSQPWGISWGGIREISVGRYLEKVRIPFEGTGNHLCVFFPDLWHAVCPNFGFAMVC